MAKTAPIEIDQTLTLALQPESLEAFQHLANSLEAIIAKATPNETELLEDDDGAPYPDEVQRAHRTQVAAGQWAPAHVREATEAPEMFSLPRISYRRLLSDGLRVKNERDRARQKAHKLRAELEDARQHAQHHVTRWRDAEAEIKRLRAKLGGDGNVLEANAQLRAENAKLVEDRDTIEADRDDLEERVEELLSENRQLAEAAQSLKRQLIDRGFTAAAAQSDPPVPPEPF